MKSSIGKFGYELSRKQTSAIENLGTRIHESFVAISRAFYASGHIKGRKRIGTTSILQKSYG